MPSVIVEGQDEVALNQALLEHYNPGDKIDLRISLPRVLSDSELQYIADELHKYGTDVHFVEQAEDPYPFTLRIVFTRPPRITGYALAVPSIYAILAVIGIGGFLAWKTSNFIDTIARNVIPLAVIMVSGGVIAAWIFRPERAQEFQRHA